MALWFKNLTSIRCLKINACKLEGFPSNISNLKLLRYLDIPYAGEKPLSQHFFKLYNLQYLHLKGWQGCELFDRQVTNEFSKLINLRIFYPIDKVISSISSSGKLIYLETFPQYTVKKEAESDIHQLKGMNQVRGSLCVRNLENVEGKEHALQAGLNNKKYLDELILEWSPGTGCNQISQVIEGLQPHQNLKILEIRQYSGLKFPAWLGNLPNLTSLAIFDSLHLCEFPKIPLSVTRLKLVNVGVTSLPILCDISLKFLVSLQHVLSKKSALMDLHIEGCPKIESLKEWLLPDYFPNMKSICIKNCEGLKLLPADQIINFNSLQTLEIISCNSIDQQISLPRKISRLELDNSKLWNLNCFHRLTSMVTLRLHRCQIIKDAKHLTHLVSLKYLSMQDCVALCCLSGLETLTNLQSLSIIKCPNLCRPGGNTKEKRTGPIKTLQSLTIDNSKIVRLQILRNPPQSLACTVCESDEKLIFKDDENWIRNIRSLCIRSCKNLESLPHNLDGLKRPDLVIIDCPNIKSLPSGIRNLPSSITEAHCIELWKQRRNTRPPRNIEFRPV